MRILSFIPALAALVTAVASVAVPDTCTGSEMKCVSDVGHKRELIQHPSRNLRATTNAELLRRGLPLNRPILRRGTPVRRTNPSSVSDDPVQVDPVQVDPVQVDPVQVDPVQVDKVTYTGVIEILNANNGHVIGYISKNLGNGGTQFVYDPSISNALIVSFQTDGTGDGTQLDISILGSNPDWPLLGLIQGRDDFDSSLSPGNYEFLYFGGVASPGTQPNEPPTLINNSYFIGSPRTAETAVWTFTSSTWELTPQWVNPDKSYPVQQMWIQSAGLYVGGSVDAYNARYPAPVTLIKLAFVPQ